MRLLLDTHALVWSVDKPEQLSPAAHAALSDPAACAESRSEKAERPERRPGRVADAEVSVPRQKVFLCFRASS